MYKRFSFDGITVHTRSKKWDRSKYQLRIMRAHLMHILARLILPNSGISALLALGIAPIAAAHCV